MLLVIKGKSLITGTASSSIHHHEPVLVVICHYSMACKAEFNHSIPFRVSLARLSEHWKAGLWVAVPLWHIFKLTEIFLYIKCVFVVLNTAHFLQKLKGEGG